MSHVADGELHACLDGALDALGAEEAKRIRDHVAGCAECAARLEEERAVRERVAAILALADPGAVPLDSLRELEARAEATRAGTAAGSGADGPRVAAWWRRPPTVAMGWAASIALALWVGYSVKELAPGPRSLESPAVATPAAQDRASPADRELEADAPVTIEAAPTLRKAAADVPAEPPARAEPEAFVAEAAESAVAGGAGAPVSSPATPLVQSQEADQQPRAARADRVSALRDRALRPNSGQVRAAPDAPLEARLGRRDDLAAAAGNEGSAISGTVVDAKTGTPLAGAQVVVDGTNRGALTDQAGRFVIPGMPAGEGSVSAVVLGYARERQTVALAPGDTAELAFSLTESAVQVDGVTVNVVPGEAPRRELGTTARRISVDSLALAGLTLRGIPGADTALGRIRMRGASTIASGNEPLMVVDGVRFRSASSGVATDARLSDLNPVDIESIDVLKGDQAVARYGEEGANGVVLITTTSGRVAVPSLEVRRVDRVELPGLGENTLVVQDLPDGEELQIWSLTAQELAPDTFSKERQAAIRAFFERSLPRGWSMVVRWEKGRYLVARAPGSAEHLEALLDRRTPGG